MKLGAALIAGFTGAGALTVMHQKLQKTNENAPRMDLLAMNALAKFLKLPQDKLNNDPEAYNLTLLGDIISNSLYYSLIGIGGKNKIFLRGAALGLLAGIGAVVLPEYLHLNPAYSGRTKETKALTILLYVLGGIAASAEYKVETRDKRKKKK